MVKPLEAGQRQFRNAEKKIFSLTLSILRVILILVVQWTTKQHNSEPDWQDLIMKNERIIIGLLILNLIICVLAPLAYRVTVNEKNVEEIVRVYADRAEERRRRSLWPAQWRQPMPDAMRQEYAIMELRRVLAHLEQSSLVGLRQDSETLSQTHWLIDRLSKWSDMTEPERKALFYEYVEQLPKDRPGIFTAPIEPMRDPHWRSDPNQLQCF